MLDPLHERFRELNWRRKLSAAEENELRAWLAAHPEAEAEWEVEAGLTEALARMPNVPVASNFTARVLRAVEQEEAADARSNRPELHRRWPFLKWLPRTAVATMVLAA